MSESQYVALPVPAYATSLCHRLYRLANIIPEGRWASYGQLGEAAEMGVRGDVGKAVAASMSQASPLVDDPDSTAWCAPWHRVRVDTGEVVARGAQHNQDQRIATCQNLYLREGGHLDHQGRAVASERFDIVAEARRVGLLSGRAVGPRAAISAERQAVLDERAAERARRMSGKH